MKTSGHWEREDGVFFGVLIIGAGSLGGLFFSPLVPVSFNAISIGSFVVGLLMILLYGKGGADD